MLTIFTQGVHRIQMHTIYTPRYTKVLFLLLIPESSISIDFIASIDASELTPVKAANMYALRLHCNSGRVKHARRGAHVRDGKQIVGSALNETRRRNRPCWLAKSNRRVSRIKRLISEIRSLRAKSRDVDVVMQCATTRDTPDV